MNIRNYNNNDYPEVISILKDSDLFDEVWDSKENLNSIINKNPQSIQVIEEKGKVIGNIFIISYGKKVSYLFRLAVKKEFREKGVGSALIKKAEEIIKQQGATEVGFYVDSKNINLQEYYIKRGFKISPKSYYYMWKEL